MGVARQYCGRHGEGGQLPGGDVPGLCPRWDGHWWTPGLYLLESWTSALTGVRRRFCHRQVYRPRRSWPGVILWRSQERATEGWMGRGGRRLQDARRLQSGPGGRGDRNVLDVPSGFTGRRSLPGPVRSIIDSGVPGPPRLHGQRRSMEQRSDELPEEACREDYGGR